MALTTSALLLIPVPLMAMKFRSFRWKDSKFRYVFVGSAILLFVIFRWTGIPLIILSYIILSLLARKSKTT
jgi:CDP-diacylglycerol--serine O-phosphatidyltransferase